MHMRMRSCTMKARHRFPSGDKGLKVTQTSWRGVKLATTRAGQQSGVYVISRVKNAYSQVTCARSQVSTCHSSSPIWQRHHCSEISQVLLVAMAVRTLGKGRLTCHLFKATLQERTRLKTPTHKLQLLQLLLLTTWKLLPAMKVLVSMQVCRNVIEI